jgi:hypothetical protein
LNAGQTLPKSAAFIAARVFSPKNKWIITFSNPVVKSLVPQCRKRVCVKVLHRAIEIAAAKAQNLPSQVGGSIAEGRFRAFVGAVSNCQLNHPKI